MVVKKDRAGLLKISSLDIGYLGGFLSLRMNELVLEAAARAGFTEIRESHGYVLQHFIDSDRGVTELARRMEVSQQAASKAVAEIVDIGLLEQAPSDDRRSKRIRLSKKGWKLVKTTRRARKRLEKKLLAKVDRHSYEKTRSALIECLEELGKVERVLSRRVRAPR
jgi:DNA-binding MarR family transcriptional regulator